MKKILSAFVCAAVLSSTLPANECVCFELKGEFGEEIKAILQKYSKNSCWPNPRTHQNDHSPWSSRLHPRDAGMVQYTEIHQCNPLYKQTKKKKIIIS